VSAAFISFCLMLSSQCVFALSQCHYNLYKSSFVLQKLFNTLLVIKKIACYVRQVVISDEDNDHKQRGCVNPLTPTVAIWVLLENILCQTRLSGHL